jgi:hypothetical protein
MDTELKSPEEICAYFHQIITKKSPNNLIKTIVTKAVI